MQAASNIGASAKAGMDKTKAVVQEKAEKMTTSDPIKKQIAEEKKQVKIHEAEQMKMETRAQSQAAKHSPTGGLGGLTHGTHGTTGHGTHGTTGLHDPNHGVTTGGVGTGTGTGVGTGTGTGTGHTGHTGIGGLLGKGTGHKGVHDPRV